jgi:hypothetical protein
MVDGTYHSVLDRWGLTANAVDAPTVNGRPTAPSVGRAPARPRCCA